eukprot:s128_g23.t3
MRTGAFVESRDSAMQARQLYRDLLDRDQEVLAMLQASQASALHGDRPMALEVVSEAKDVARRANRRHAEGICWHTLASLHLDWGRLADAAKMAKKALSCAKRSGSHKDDSERMVKALGGSPQRSACGTASAGGGVARWCVTVAGSREESGGHLEAELQQLADRVGAAEPLCTACSHHASAAVQLHKGNCEEALRAAQLALAAYEESSDLVGVLQMYLVMAKTLLVGRFFHEAREATESAAWLGRQLGFRSQAGDPGEHGKHGERSRIPEMPTVPKMDVQALDVEVLRGVIQQFVQVLIAHDENIDPERSGCHSQPGFGDVVSDQLAKVLPGLSPPLPVTLIYDYPSIAAITRLVTGASPASGAQASSARPSDIVAQFHWPGSTEKFRQIEVFCFSHWQLLRFLQHLFIIFLGGNNMKQLNFFAVGVNLETADVAHGEDRVPFDVFANAQPRLTAMAQKGTPSASKAVLDFDPNEADPVAVEQTRRLLSQVEATRGPDGLRKVLHVTRAMDFLSLWTIVFLVSTVTTSPAKDEPRPEPKKSAAPAGSCWSVGFSFESCCAPEFGPEGNTECWDDVYTFESCCESGGDPQKVGCNSSYFRRFRNLAFEYYNLGRSKPALIELWPRILANYDARFLLCPPAALQAQLLQIEERGFLERPETVTEQLLSYTRNLQHAFTTESASSVDFDQWPLQLGLEKLRQSSRIKAQQRRFRRFPDVTLVLSYCREELSWMNSSFSRKVMPKVDVVMVAKCPGVDAIEAVPFKHLWRSVEQLDAAI